MSAERTERHRLPSAAGRDKRRTLADLIGAISQWAEQREDIQALALVGSHARDQGRPDSDVDLVVLSGDAEGLCQQAGWVARFGRSLGTRTERYGAMSALRVDYEQGWEVEFGIVDPTWASLPLDGGTRRVITDGLRILYDPIGLLRQAVEAADEPVGGQGESVESPVQPPRRRSRRWVST